MSSPWTRAAVGTVLILLVFYFSIVELPYIIADNLT